MAERVAPLLEDAKCLVGGVPFDAELVCDRVGRQGLVGVFEESFGALFAAQRFHLSVIRTFVLNFKYVTRPHGKPASRSITVLFDLLTVLLVQPVLVLVTHPGSFEHEIQS
ncbi:hypothetical protein G3I44_14215 [Halogeometricum borinquense]|uniref:Uncharacterized protein n=1 Tax=Halogeometricum borinquense TaxID=60847 RepID=A0A6C0UJH3_9EURY|nr:hypothetical protein [Halogeometricum borinquense]QIB75340.1 hypothetical protein G3I44_14215 [Halogeometricum borinquense]